MSDRGVVGACSTFACEGGGGGEVPSVTVEGAGGGGGEGGGEEEGANGGTVVYRQMRGRRVVSMTLESSALE